MNTNAKSDARRRRVCVVTGTRAEYGLLYWLMRALQSAPNIDLQVFATAAHLSPEFGLTWREIESDGFKIDEKVEMLLSSDTGVGIAKSIGLGVAGLADAFARHSPDIIVLLGDRFEALAAAAAAMAMGIPIAHIHGGELTEGLVDEAIRHSITKMAQIHFVAAERFGRRVMQLGEQPANVFVTGGLGADAVAGTAQMSRAELENALGIELMSPTLLVTYHPVTLHKNPSELVQGLIDAFGSLPQASFIITGTNADAGGREIERKIKAFVDERQGNAVWKSNLGQRLYVNAMRYADVVVGNSSSGLLEAPHVGVPTVNIGVRQQGRLRAPSVIDCDETAESLRAAISRALTPEFKAIADRRETPYGSPNAADRMCKILSEIELDGILFKKFHDLDGAPI